MAFETLALAACMFVASALYSSVGHAGASAYLALMALFGLPPGVMRPTALVLNVVVAAFTSYRFVQAGLFRWRVLWPILLGAAPMAFVGGSIVLPGDFYRPLVGVVLLIAAARILFARKLGGDAEPHDPPILPAVLSGACIGLLSGLTGTGGGIFLSPLLLLLSWSDTRTTSGVAAVFILVNSASGLLGNVASVGQLPADLPWFVGAVLLGAAVGTTFGISRLAPRGILKALALVLAIAGGKLILVA